MQVPTTVSPIPETDIMQAPTTVSPTPEVHMWQDAYAEFLKENRPINEVDFDTIFDSPEITFEQSNFMAFSAAGYPIVPYFYLYDIDKNGIPELIYIDVMMEWDIDVYTYKNSTVSKIGIIAFYPFGGLGIPLDKTEGIYSDIGYKGHYGEIYYYTLTNDVLTEDLVLEYNNQEWSPEKPGLPYSYDNFIWLDYYEVTEENINKVIYGV